MKRTVMAAIGGIALLTGTAFAAAPLAAQEAESEELAAEEARALGDMFGDMFGTAEPLSLEQEARVPAAMLVVSKLFPKGTYARMMEDSMAPMMESMTGSFGAGSALSLAQLTGLDPLDLSGLDSDRLSKAAELLDPAGQDRNNAATEMMFALVGEVMVDIEPAYRAGLARAYAVRFTNDELMDLDAYFETEVGKKYAAESFLIFADPQVMSAMNEMMPAIMERMPDMMAATTAIEDSFPASRSYSDLTAVEQGQLAELLGVSKETLAESESMRTEPAGAF